MEKFKGIKYYADLHGIGAVSEMQQLQRDIMLEATNKKEELLKRLVEHYLGPNWTEEEVKRDFALVTHTLYPDREFISFRGAQIGEIKMDVTIYPDTFTTTITYTFTPSEKIS